MKTEVIEKKGLLVEIDNKEVKEEVKEEVIEEEREDAEETTNSDCLPNLILKNMAPNNLFFQTIILGFQA